tara:strand:- start:13261 stop:13389 length:129 start_codon:yes stop_codon:yes gene_type:complete
MYSNKNPGFLLSQTRKNPVLSVFVLLPDNKSDQKMIKTKGFH